VRNDNSVDLSRSRSQKTLHAVSPGGLRVPIYMGTGKTIEALVASGREDRAVRHAARFGPRFELRIGLKLRPAHRQLDPAAWDPIQILTSVVNSFGQTHHEHPVNLFVLRHQKRGFRHECWGQPHRWNSPWAISQAASAE